MAVVTTSHIGRTITIKASMSAQYAGGHVISKVPERTESRKIAYRRQFRDAGLGLFIWSSPGCRYIDVRELDTDQIEIAIAHFEKRKHECVEELARRAGEPKPNFAL